MHPAEPPDTLEIYHTRTSAVCTISQLTTRIRHPFYYIIRSQYDITRKNIIPISELVELTH